MTEICYICQGSCEGMVTEEEFDEGFTTCGDESCERHGMPLQRMHYCSDCGVTFEHEDDHSCY